MKIRINSKPINPDPVKQEYSDAQGYAVMAIGFAIIAFLLKYWGWL